MLERIMTAPNDEIRAAVVAEFKLLVEHYRQTATVGTPIDKWIYDGLRWYEEER
jgi:hypothetical protein